MVKKPKFNIQPQQSSTEEWTGYSTNIAMIGTALFGPEKATGKGQ